MENPYTTRLPENERVYYPRRDRCQFSWYCDGKSDKFPHYDYESIHDAWLVAELLLNPEIKFVDITEGATHYHADYVSPDGQKHLQKQLLSITISSIVGNLTLALSLIYDTFHCRCSIEVYVLNLCSTRRR